MDGQRKFVVYININYLRTNLQFKANNADKLEKKNIFLSIYIAITKVIIALRWQTFVRRKDHKKKKTENGDWSFIHIFVTCK